MDANLANPIRNTKYLQPQNEWKWPIVIYVYLAGMGAGAFIIGVIWDWLGYVVYPSNIILPTPLLSPDYKRIRLNES